MQTIPLGSTGRTTSRLGFGCSTLMGSIGRRASLAVLEAAYDNGIRHFDVAPMYGYGEAESCLGEFLARHSGDVTVTTKYGIAPPKNRSFFRVARTIAGPIIRQFPVAKKSLAAAAKASVQASAQPAQRKIFTADRARTSLDSSLTALKTDHIDIWLLHEATAEDLTDTALLGFLQDCVAQGKIGAFGVGSDNSRIPALLAQRPDYCSILQYEWSVFDPVIPAGPPFRIHHRALSARLHSLHEDLLAHPDQLRNWSQATDSDLADTTVLSKLMLKAALLMNPQSLILFSSKQAKRIQANAFVSEDRALEEPAKLLYELVQTDIAQKTIHS
ncbi:MAG TPA: aldo/keto reductase [Edaphobacter sp.]|jgi:aryl-alcohol dehydrogenase-like predicted oxidoreductase|nr:aldo/keto reductase [Edaphobacter sp.]